MLAELINYTQAKVFDKLLDVILHNHHFFSQDDSYGNHVSFRLLSGKSLALFLLHSAQLRSCTPMLTLVYLHLLITTHGRTVIIKTRCNISINKYISVQNQCITAHEKATIDAHLCVSNGGHIDNEVHKKEKLLYRVRCFSC